MEINFKDLKLNVEYLETGAIKPFQRNPRTHSKEQIAQIATSMSKFGFVNPILIDEDFEIIAGHGRLLGAKECGFTTVPVVQLQHLSKAEKMALLVADNKISDNAGWDEDLLKSILEELNEENFDLTALAFSNKEIERYKTEFAKEQELAEVEDVVPEIAETGIVSEKGDLWILGNHILLCGDSCDPESYTALMGDERAAMTFTDPPYNVAYDPSFRKKSDTADELGPIKNDDLGKEFRSFLISALKHVVQYTDGSMYICMGGSELHTLYDTFTAAGGRWESYIVWVKSAFSLSRARYQRQHEWMLFGNTDPVYAEEHERILLGKRKDKTPGWYGGRNQSDVWNFDKPLRNDIHPTMKPVALVERAINNSSRANEIVLDAFGGSGSTLIAAEKTNRCCRMIELDEKYVDTIIKRWQEFTGGTAVHKATGKTFAELAVERK